MKCSAELYPTPLGGVYGILLTCDDATFRGKVLEYVEYHLASSRLEVPKEYIDATLSPVVIVFDMDRKERAEDPPNVRGFMAQSYLIALKNVIKYMEERYVKGQYI